MNRHASKLLLKSSLRDGRRLNAGGPTKAVPGAESSDRGLGGRFERLSKQVLAFISLVVLLLTMLGFSYALALETTFGPDTLEILRGPGDYLAASSSVVAAAFMLLSDAVGNREFEQSDIAAGVLVFTVILVLGLIGIWLYDLIKAPPSATKESVKKFNALLRQLRSKITLWRPAALVMTAVISGLTAWLLTRLILWIFLLVVFFAILPFYIGYGITQRHFISNVIQPLECIQPSTRQQRLDAISKAKSKRANESKKAATTVYAAHCVEVVPQQGPPIKGRRVVATAEQIVLFDPVSGQVQIVPRKDATIRMVGAL